MYSTLGAGYSESVYQRALEIELRSIENVKSVQTECTYSIKYKGKSIGFYRIDILVQFVVQDLPFYVIIELKTVQKITPQIMEQGRRYLEDFRSHEHVNTDCCVINMPCIPDSVQCFFV